MFKQVIIYPIVSILSVSAFAQDSKSMTDKEGDSIVRRVSELNLEIELMKKQIEYEELNNKKNAPKPTEAAYGMPKVVDIFQHPDEPIMARLVYFNGDTKIVKEGQVIDGGAKVTAITSRSVIVRHKGKGISLDFAVNTLPLPSNGIGQNGNQGVTNGIPASLSGFGR